jgi:hypothetical protein
LNVARYNDIGVAASASQRTTDHLLLCPSIEVYHRKFMFTRETIEQSQAAGFMLPFNTFETVTQSLVSDGAIFP